MHSLKPGGIAIPRAYADHRTLDGHQYRLYVTGILARLGPLPSDAMPTLREVGRLAVELAGMGLELETARARGRRRDVARLRRQMVPMRTQLITLERRLDELAARQRPVDPLADVRRAVAEANR